MACTSVREATCLYQTPIAHGGEHTEAEQVNDGKRGFVSKRLNNFLFCTILPTRVATAVPTGVGGASKTQVAKVELKRLQ